MGNGSPKEAHHSPELLALASVGTLNRDSWAWLVSGWGASCEALTSPCRGGQPSAFAITHVGCKVG